MRQLKAIPKEERCSKPDVSGGGGWHFNQCERRGTITEDGKLWCFQHAPSAKRKRSAESRERFDAETKRRNAPYKELDRLRAVNAKLLAALEASYQVLSGHHDAMGHDYEMEYATDNTCVGCDALKLARDAIEEATK